MARQRRKVWTQISVDNIKADPLKRREHPDPGVPGLWLVVQPSDRRSWAVRYRRSVDGKPRKLTLPGFASLGVARDLAREALDKAAKGGDPAGDKQAARRAPAPTSASTVDDAFVLYLANANRSRRGQAIRESTRYESGRMLGFKRGADGQWSKTGNGAVHRWQGRPLASITHADVMLLIDKIAEDAPVGANRTLAVLKACFNWLVKRQLLAVSPAEGVDKPSAESPRERVLSDQELAALWRAADAEAYPIGSMIKLLALTGTRRDEAREAERSEIDLAEGTWTIPGGRTKNGRAHVIPLSDPAVALLEAIKPIGKKYVFTLSGDKPATDVVRTKARIHAAMGSPPQWGLHDLRRTFATGLQRLGFRQEVCEACLNHTGGVVSGVAAIYGRHDYADEKRAAFAAWAAHVLALVEGKPAGGKVIQMKRG